MKLVFGKAHEKVRRDVCLMDDSAPTNVNPLRFDRAAVPVQKKADESVVGGCQNLVNELSPIVGFERAALRTDALTACVAGSGKRVLKKPALDLGLAPTAPPQGSDFSFGGFLGVRVPIASELGAENGSAVTASESREIV
jgi:hypothetical protein